MLVPLGANAEHGKRREAGDYRKAYDIACRYKLMPPADTGAVAKLLRCSDRWARELTAEARQRERAEREEAIVRAHDDGKTVREIAEDTGVHNSTVVRALAAKGEPSALQQEAEDPGPGPDPYADARVIYGPTGQRWHRALEALRAVNAQAEVSAMFAERYTGVDHAIEPELRRARQAPALCRGRSQEP